MNVTDLDAPGEERRPGRPRKEDKRLPLSLRVSPEMRRRLDAMAEQNSRTISQQTEVLLEHALNGGGLGFGVPPASAKKGEATHQQARSPDEDESLLLGVLEHRFG